MIYISCLEQIFKNFIFSNEVTLRTKSEMGPLTNHHLSRFYNKRKTTWSGAVYIWAASYWGESRNLLKIIDKIWRHLLVKNPCFSRHLDRHDIATFAIQLVNIKLQKAFGFDKYYQLPIQSQCPCPIITFEIKKWSNPLRLLGQCLVPRPPFLRVSLFA